MSLIKLSIFSILVLLTGTLTIQAQDDDSTGLPGDHFSLQGALEMFKKAESPEDFEKLINSENNSVNNLDLNEDGEIDYVKVIGRKEKDAHIFILQIPISDKENQDIAVIELEKTGTEHAVLQIVGDEDIYGEEVIIEASDGSDEDAPVALSDVSHGPNAGSFYKSTGIVNVWFWPSVQFVYHPAYTVWASPWHWRTYPNWWKPWKPRPWYAYRPLRVHYYAGCRVARTHRVIHAHRVYRPARVSSVYVNNRHARVVNNYRVTKTRTTVTRPKGNTYSKNTTTVRNGHGQVKYKKVKVRKGKRG
jgi:hypothetical protein